RGECQTFCLIIGTGTAVRQSEENRVVAYRFSARAGGHREGASGSGEAIPSPVSSPGLTVISGNGTLLHCRKECQFRLRNQCRNSPPSEQDDGVRATRKPRGHYCVPCRLRMEGTGAMQILEDCWPFS